MVKRTMTINRFLLDARSATQQQQTQSRNQTPLAAHSLKRQRTADQPPRVSRDAPPPLAWAVGGIVIWEPTGGARLSAQVKSSVTSSSRPIMGWQAIFKLRIEPLPVTASVRSWAQGEGGRVTQSLGQGLQLLEVVHFFSGDTDESPATRLQWHTIKVIYLILPLLHKCSSISFFFFHAYCYWGTRQHNWLT